MVPLERFESVCHELDSALSRERQAQDMLTKQAHQLKTITQAMNRQAADGTEKEETLTELVQVCRIYYPNNKSIIYNSIMSI